VQKERQSGCFFSTEQEYFKYWGLTEKRLTMAREDAIIMHPGPMNKGVEIDHRTASGHRSVILEQVTNGIAIRMAALYLLSYRKV
jgi:aspartate carbamoyltransferase catalytic subunit